MIRLIVMYVLLIPCAGLFIYENNRGPEPKFRLLASIFKGFATWIILCGALAGMLGRGAEPQVYMLLIAAGLAMGLSGDVALSMPDPGFLSGMLFFGLGHLCYIAAFIILSSQAIWAIPIFVVVYAVALIVLITMKNNGKCPKQLFLPVLVYSGIILAMASLAATMPISAFPHGFLLLAAAILFAVSDALLARNKFEAVLAGEKAAATRLKSFSLSHVERGIISLCCYFLAQSLFAVSVYVSF